MRKMQVKQRAETQKEKQELLKQQLQKENEQVAVEKSKKRLVLKK